MKRLVYLGTTFENYVLHAVVRDPSNLSYPQRPVLRCQGFTVPRGAVDDGATFLTCFWCLLERGRW